MTFEDFIEEWNDASSFITAHTSGSTGIPKPIRLDKEFVRGSALRTNSFFDINAGSLLYSCISPEFIGGKMMAVRSQIAGCDFMWEKPSNRALEEFRQGREITLLSVVPSQMVHILDNKGRMPIIKNILIGGSPIPKKLRSRISESGYDCFESYGMTETASHIALRKVIEDPIPFHTLPGIEVERDSRGCLVIKFETGESFVTNDVARVFNSHEFLIEGRADNIIISGGKKINPMEIEERLAPLFESEIMITSEPDEKWGRRVVLMIEDERWGGKGRVAEQRMREVLQPWEYPKKIIAVEALPRTPNGKLKRNC